MSKHRLLLVLLIPSLAGSVSGQPSPNAQTPGSPSIVGTWRVVSVETIRPNGEALTEWLGKRPTGTIVYLPSGYMAVQIMRDPRPVIAGAGYENATPAEKATAMDGYYAYYGTYEVDASSSTVVHNIQASLRPNEVGIRYQRRFELIGDRLTLTTPPSDRSGEPRFNRLVWERVR